MDIKREIAACLGDLLNTEGDSVTPQQIRKVTESALKRMEEAGFIGSMGDVEVTAFCTLEARIQHRILWKWMELQYAGVYDADLRLPLDEAMLKFMGPDARWLIGERLVSPNGIIPAEDDEDAYEVFADPGDPSYRYLVDTKITLAQPLHYINMTLELGDEE
jgi:hypothetical protein